MSKHYDVVIIGAGPAGIFAAMELADAKPDLKIVIIEKGRDIKDRSCPMSERRIPCCHCEHCAITSGWGGAGAFSDGKLTLTSEFGGWLDQYMSKEEVLEWIHYVDQVYVKFGGTDKVFGADEAQIKEIRRQAATADLILMPARIRHLGTEENYKILTRMREYLEQRVEVCTKTMVEEIIVKDGEVQGVRLAGGEELSAKMVISVPGREGHEWFSEEAKRLKLPMANNPVDIGVRVEVPAVVMEHLTDVIYESKLVYYSKSFDDRVRTFCMNPYGEVVVENTRGLQTVNGHSWAAKRSENTNFALLVSKTFTEPFKEPITYGKYIASLANLLGGGVIVQRLGDLLEGRRSTHERLARGIVTPTLPEATPGDLSLVLPYRHLTAIIEMLEALDKIAPGVNSRHTLLYGVEVKFYSSRLHLTKQLETQVKNLFAGGDGACVTRGLAQASATGVIIAREILNRL